MIFLCKTPSNLCDVLEVKRQYDHHYHRRQHHHYCRHHYHLRIMIIMIIIIIIFSPTFLTDCMLIFVLFSYCKTHNQREESIQRLYLQRASLNDDKYLLSEEERVIFLNTFFMWCNIVTNLPMGSGGGWTFQLLMKNVVDGLVVV